MVAVNTFPIPSSPINIPIIVQRHWASSYTSSLPPSYLSRLNQHPEQDESSLAIPVVIFSLFTLFYSFPIITAAS
jgi:hypothetical protein